MVIYYMICSCFPTAMQGFILFMQNPLKYNEYLTEKYGPVSGYALKIGSSLMRHVHACMCYA